MNLFDKFKTLEDPRDIRGKKHELINILIMTIYAILCGQEDYTNIAYFMKIKEEYFTDLLKLENGTSSHDCLSYLFARIDPKKFMEVFIEWIKEMVKMKSGGNISIDGKAVKSTTDKINGAINLASIDDSFGKVPLKRKFTQYVLDFKNIERLIFEVIPQATF